MTESLGLPVITPRIEVSSVTIVLHRRSPPEVLVSGTVSNFVSRKTGKRCEVVLTKRPVDLTPAARGLLKEIIEKFRTIAPADAEQALSKPVVPPRPTKMEPN